MKKLLLLILLAFIPVHIFVSDEVTVGGGAAALDHRDETSQLADLVLNGGPHVGAKDFRLALSDKNTMEKIKQFLVEEILFKQIYQGKKHAFFRDFASEPDGLNDRDDFFDSNGLIMKKFNEYAKTLVRRLKNLNRTRKTSRSIEEIRELDNEIKETLENIKKIARAVLLSLVYESLLDLQREEDLKDGFSYEQINQAVQNILGKTYYVGLGHRVTAEEHNFLEKNDVVIDLFKLFQKILNKEEAAILFTCFDIDHVASGEERKQGKGRRSRKIIFGRHLLQSSNGERIDIGSEKKRGNFNTKYPCMISPNIYNLHIVLNYADLKPITHYSLKTMWPVEKTVEQILTDVYTSKMFAYLENGEKRSYQLRAVPGSGRVIYIGSKYSKSLSPQLIQTAFPIDVLPYPYDVLTADDDICIARLGIMDMKEDVTSDLVINVLEDLTITKQEFLQILNEAKREEKNCLSVPGQSKETFVVNITNEMKNLLIEKYNSNTDIMNVLRSNLTYFAWGERGAEENVFKGIDVTPFDDNLQRHHPKGNVNHPKTKIMYPDYLFYASQSRHPKFRHQNHTPLMIYDFLKSSSSDSEDPETFQRRFSSSGRGGGGGAGK